MNATEPGKLLRGCTCVAVPFAGGMCEVPHFTANIVNVNDLDRHVINLCEVVRQQRRELVDELNATPFHPEALAKSQAMCRWYEKQKITNIPILTWAYHYFVASWMTRGGSGGTGKEFDGGLSVRFKSTGGDSCKRFRSATESLAEWEKVMQRCTFHTLDCFEFLDECRARDIAANGIYCDPPWPDDGDTYKHRIESHGKLSTVLEAFEQTKIVVRYGDHPLIRDLYPVSRWTWHRLTSRTQANDAKAEVLLTRNI